MLRRILSTILIASLAAVSGAQTALEESGEAYTNRRQPPAEVMATIGVKPGLVIGEVGAGRGRYTVHLAARVGPSGKIYAEDIDSDSLEYLRSRCRRSGLSNVEILRGDVENPNFPDASLDMVFMILTYHHLARPVTLLNNLIPSLKPGATVVVVDPDAAKDPGSRASEYTSREKIVKEAGEAGFEIARVETFLPRDNIFILQLKAAARAPFPVLSGPYLGQKIPGTEAELFAPGLVSTGMTERAVAVSPDGREILFEQAAGRIVTIMSTRLEDGRWTEPAVPPFAADLAFNHFEPAFSADGKTVLFLTTRPRAGAPPKPGWANQNIWAANREPDGRWGEPYDLGPPINTDAGEYFPSLTNDGTLYFTRAGGPGRDPKIMRARRIEGRYKTPEPLPEAVNGHGPVYNACVAPDESFLIACVDGRANSFASGKANYYIFFRTPDDRWSEAVNLGPGVNFPGAAASAPSLTRDGRFLFFGSTRGREFAAASALPVTSRQLLDYFAAPGNGNSDVYWIDASFLKKLKPRL